MSSAVWSRSSSCSSAARSDRSPPARRPPRSSCPTTGTSSTSSGSACSPSSTSSASGRAVGIASTVAGRLGRRRRQLASMAFVAVALGTVGTLYAAVAPKGEAATTADPAVERGRALYSRGCSSCHGLNGEGGQRAPSLIGVGAASVDFQVGTGRMPLREHGPQAPGKKPTYNEQQIRELDAYVASLGAGPSIPSFTTQDLQKADTAYGGAPFPPHPAPGPNLARPRGGR